MSSRWNRFHRPAAAVLAALTLSAVAVQPTVAQGFFESLFGNVRSRSAPSLPPQASAFANPFGLFGPERRPPSGEISGPATSYCVRTCDGRFFPMQRHASASPAELCQSFCPSAQTMVFHGSKIDHAVGPKGVRYSGLDNAFLYRQRVVDNCTCNGKDAFGLARIDVKEDPTLKVGDIVATNDGLVTVRNPKTADYTPISPTSKLADVKITPAAPPRKVERVVNNPAPAKKRAVQLAR